MAIESDNIVIYFLVKLLCNLLILISLQELVSLALQIPSKLLEHLTLFGDAQGQIGTIIYGVIDIFNLLLNLID